MPMRSWHFVKAINSQWPNSLWESISSPGLKVCLSVFTVLTHVYLKPIQKKRRKLWQLTPIQIFSHLHDTSLNSEHQLYLKDPKVYNKQRFTHIVFYLADIIITNQNDKEQLGSLQDVGMNCESREETMKEQVDILLEICDLFRSTATEGRYQASTGKDSDNFGDVQHNLSDWTKEAARVTELLGEISAKFSLLHLLQNLSGHRTSLHARMKLKLSLDESSWTTSLWSDTTE